MQYQKNGARPPIKPRLTPEAQRLTNIRLYLDLKVQDVANSLNVNQARISELERGIKPLTPSMKTLKEELDVYYRRVATRRKN